SSAPTSGPPTCAVPICATASSSPCRNWPPPGATPGPSCPPGPSTRRTGRADRGTPGVEFAGRGCCRTPGARGGPPVGSVVGVGEDGVGLDDGEGGGRSI